MIIAKVLLICLASNIRIINGGNSWNKRVTELTLGDLIDNSGDILRELNYRGVSIPYVDYGRRGNRGYNYGRKEYDREVPVNSNRPSEPKKSPSKNQNNNRQPPPKDKTDKKPTKQPKNTNKRPPRDVVFVEDDDDDLTTEDDSEDYVDEKYLQMLQNIRNQKKKAQR